MTTTTTTRKPDWHLEDNFYKSDWDVFSAFLGEGAPFFDDVDPTDWAIDYVNILLDEFDWESLEVPYGRQPFDFRKDAEDNSTSLIDQVCDAIARELAEADPIDEGDEAITAVGHIRGGNRIIRSVAFAWLADDRFHAHKGYAKDCVRPPNWGCPYTTPSAANRARAMAEDDAYELHNAGDPAAAAAEAE